MCGCLKKEFVFCCCFNILLPSLLTDKKVEDWNNDETKIWFFTSRKTKTKKRGSPNRISKKQ